MPDGIPAQSGEAFFGMTAPLPFEEGTDDHTDDVDSNEDGSLEVSPEGELQQPSTPEGEQPAEPAVPAEPVGDQQPPTTETPSKDQEPSQEPDLILGRYRTVEELADAYTNVQRFEARTREDLTAAQRQLDELAVREAAAIQRAQELENGLRYIALQLQAETGQAPSPEQIANFIATNQPSQAPQQAPPVVSQGQPQTPQPSTVEELAQQRLAEMRAQEQMAQAAQEVDSFRVAFPDAQRGSEIDALMGRIVADLQRDPETGQPDPSLWPITKENLEATYVLAKSPSIYAVVNELDLIPDESNLHLARECLENPRFYEALKANRHVLEQDDDAGINWVRQQATAIPALVNTPEARAAQPTPQQMRQRAHVETGGNGAPITGAPGQQPEDPIDRAIAAYNESRGNSVFGL